METKDAGLWSITLRNKARDWISNVSAFFAGLLPHREMLPKFCSFYLDFVHSEELSKAYMLAFKPHTQGNPQGG